MPQYAEATGSPNTRDDETPRFTDATSTPPSGSTFTSSFASAPEKRQHNPNWQHEYAQFRDSRAQSGSPPPADTLTGGGVYAHGASAGDMQHVVSSIAALQREIDELRVQQAQVQAARAHLELPPQYSPRRTHGFGR